MGGIEGPLLGRKEDISSLWISSLGPIRLGTGLFKRGDAHPSVHWGQRPTPTASWEDPKNYSPPNWLSYQPARGCRRVDTRKQKSEHIYSTSTAPRRSPHTHSRLVPAQSGASVAHFRRYCRGLGREVGRCLGQGHSPRLDGPMSGSSSAARPHQLAFGCRRGRSRARRPPGPGHCRCRGGGRRR